MSSVGRPDRVAIGGGREGDADHGAALRIIHRNVAVHFHREALPVRRNAWREHRAGSRHERNLLALAVHPHQRAQIAFGLGVHVDERAGPGEIKVRGSTRCVPRNVFDNRCGNAAGFEKLGFECHREKCALVDINQMATREVAPEIAAALENFQVAGLE